MKFKQILAGTLAAAMVFTSVPMAGIRKLPAKAAEMEVVDDAECTQHEASAEQTTFSVENDEVIETPVLTMMEMPSYGLDTENFPILIEGGDAGSAAHTAIACNSPTCNVTGSTPFILKFKMKLNARTGGNTNIQVFQNPTYNMQINDNRIFMYCQNSNGKWPETEYVFGQGGRLTLDEFIGKWHEITAIYNGSGFWLFVDEKQGAAVAGRPDEFTLKNEGSNNLNFAGNNLDANFTDIEMCKGMNAFSVISSTTLTNIDAIFDAASPTALKAGEGTFTVSNTIWKYEENKTEQFYGGTNIATIILNAKKGYRFDESNIPEHITIKGEERPISAILSDDKKMMTITLDIRCADPNGEADYASDLEWVSATNGDGTLGRDVNHNGTQISLWNGTELQTFPKGLGVHTDSTIVYDISNQEYQIFTAYVGIDGSQSVHQLNNGQRYPKTVFTVEVSEDGNTYREVWRSHEKHSQGCTCGADYKNMEFAAIDVSGASRIRLKANHNSVKWNGHSDWADAKFYRTLAETETVTGYAYGSDESMGTSTVSIPESGYVKTATFNAVANTGYHFVGWYDGNTENAALVSTESALSKVMWGDLHLYAKFEEDVDKSALIDAINAKQDIVDGDAYATTYTSESRQELEEKLAAAIAVRDDESATDQQVADALAGLNSVQLQEYNFNKHSDYWDYKIACGNMADQTLEDAIWHYQIKGADSQWTDLPSDAFNGSTWMQSGNNQHGTYYWSKLGRDEMTSTFGDQSIPESEWKKAVAFAWKAADPGYYCMKLSVGNGDNGNAGNGLVMSINHVKETEEATDGKVIDNFTASANKSATSKIAKMNANDWIRLAADSQDKWVSTFEMEILNATAQEYAVQYLEETNGVENGDYTKESKQAVVDARDALQAAAGADDPDMADIDAKITALETAIANLEEYVAVTGITLSEKTANLKVGETLTLTATIEPENATNQGITWTTSNASAATVKDGVVTARKAGTATITATGADDAVATCEVTVSNPEVTVTVVAPGYIDVNLDDSEHTDSVTVEYMSLVTVRTEDENEAGEEFVGWHDGTQYVSYSSSYTLFARKNITLTPQYKAKAPEEIPDVLSRIDGYYKEETANKTQHVYTLTASRVVPAAATKTGKIEEQGFLISTKEISKENLTLTVQEDGTVVKPAGVIRKAGNSKSLIGSYILDVRTKNSPIYVKSYVIYTDKQNVKRVVCSEMATVYAN